MPELPSRYVLGFTASAIGIPSLFATALPIPLSLCISTLVLKERLHLLSYLILGGRLTTSQEDKFASLKDAGMQLSKFCGHAILRPVDCCALCHWRASRRMHV